MAFKGTTSVSGAVELKSSSIAEYDAGIDIDNPKIDDEYPEYYESVPFCNAERVELNKLPVKLETLIDIVCSHFSCSKHEVDTIKFNCSKNINEAFDDFLNLYNTHIKSLKDCESDSLLKISNENLDFFVVKVQKDNSFCILKIPKKDNMHLECLHLKTIFLNREKNHPFGGSDE